MFSAGKLEGCYPGLSFSALRLEISLFLFSCTAEARAEPQVLNIQSAVFSTVTQQWRYKIGIVTLLSLNRFSKAQIVKDFHSYLLYSCVVVNKTSDPVPVSSSTTLVISSCELFLALTHANGHSHFSVMSAWWESFSFTV